MEEYLYLLRNIDFTNVLWQILTPMIFSIADIITGFIQAVINKNVDSQKMRNGLLHKVLLIIIILLGFIIEFTFGIKLVSRSICIFIIVMESVSIAENLKKSGINLKGLSNILKEKSDNTPNENLSYLINTIDDIVKDEKINIEEGETNEKRD